ncbi:ABC transporter ATP-binding protein [Haloarchaeobius sp. DFWS5]|uniref:ABC transporter ATP-binding protein n=1 Tax=Haloarchaeobius sp. DFWS5 TaxID=3446114 RepID=UPI003EBD3492
MYPRVYVGGDATVTDDPANSRLERARDQVSRPLRRLFDEYGRAESRWLLIGLVASVLGYGATLVTPIVLGTTIDAVFTGESQYTLPFVPQAWLPTEQLAQFWLSAGLVGVALVCSAVLAWVRGVTMNYFAHGVMYTIRTDAYEKMQRLDMAFFDDKQTGEILSILNNDTSNLEVFLDNALSDTVRIAVLVVGISATLFYTNWQLASVTLVAIPLLVAFTWWFVRVIEPKYTTLRAEVGNLNTRIENGLSGIELVKTASTEEYENDRVRTVSRNLFDAEMAVLRLSYFYRPGMELLTGLVLLATFVLGGLWVAVGPPLFFSGDLSVGDFVVFVLLTQQLTPPLAQLSSIVDWYENARASGKRVCGLLDVPVSVQNAPDAVELGEVSGRIEYDDVSFAYGMADADTPSDGGEPDEVILDGIDFTVDPGETVAIVGPTGAGKSTVAKLLLRLYDVTDGAVRVDGHDVREVTMSSLRGSIGYVSQDTFLFDGTVEENVRYGAFDAGHTAVREAARAAEAHEFIEALPDGYETRVGERGVKLSGGQRQRIALARVVLQDPEVIVLDEATASVDTETELLIQRSLDEVTADRTTVAIAHRLSTIKDADTILVVDDGRIEERGTHDELLAQGRLYATLWGVQAGELDYVPQRLLDNGAESFDRKP